MHSLVNNVGARFQPLLPPLARPLYSVNNLYNCTKQSWKRRKDQPWWRMRQAFIFLCWSTNEFLQSYTQNQILSSFLTVSHLHLELCSKKKHLSLGNNAVSGELGDMAATWLGNLRKSGTSSHVRTHVPALGLVPKICVHSSLLPACLALPGLLQLTVLGASLLPDNKRITGVSSWMSKLRVKSTVSSKCSFAEDIYS